MAQTVKLIASVSYNSENFLAGKIRSLVDSGVLEYAYWIWHNPESDEKKRHAHLVVKPNKRLDTSKLRNEFKEIVAGEADPRCVLPFRPSKMSDWLLYAVHDAGYLAKKCQVRNHHYKKEDIKTTDIDLLDEDWRACHEGEDTRVSRCIELAQSGVDFGKLVQMGVVPVAQLFQFRDIWQNFYQATTERADGETHEGGNDEIHK